MTAEERRSVLIVEDEGIVARDLQETLEEMGYDAFAIASSSNEALARATERCPDIVLMDIRIKGPHDGIVTANLLRERFGVPVIYLTAHADTATLERANETEPYGYLLKPVNEAELRSAIEVGLYRHRMTKSLRERERWFSTTLRSIADAVITVDLAGNVTFMNEAAESLTGVAAPGALGRPAREIVRLLDPAQSPSPLDDALAQRKVIHVADAPLAHPTSRSLIISDSASPVEDRGELLGAVMVFRDVTTELQLRRQLELNDRLASLGTMAAGVAHEINNPLASIAGNASFVLDELRRTLETGVIDASALSEAVQAQSDLEASTERIAAIVGSLRVFGRPAAPESAEGETDVARTVAWAVRTTAHELNTRARMTADVGSALYVSIDSTRLGQVLVNLLINAAHAIEPGALDRNSVSLRARAAGGDVIIEVTDTGAGMAPEIVRRIFEPFFTTKSVGTGTGLGLAVCHGIVASAGGRLEVDSIVGRGTTFRVVLPARPAPVVTPPAALPSRASRSARILAIDDEATMLRVLKRTLRDHEVVCIDDPREALALLARDTRFDVIVTDMTMPHMTGKQLYERVLARDPEAAAKMVFLTGGVTTAEAAAFLEAVPNVALMKPLFVEPLRALIAEVLATRT